MYYFENMERILFLASFGWGFNHRYSERQFLNLRKVMSTNGLLALINFTEDRKTLIKALISHYFDDYLEAVQYQTRLWLGTYGIVIEIEIDFFGYFDECDDFVEFEQDDFEYHKNELGALLSKYLDIQGLDVFENFTFAYHPKLEWIEMK